MTELICISDRYQPYNDAYIQRYVDIARMLLAHGADFDFQPGNVRLHQVFGRRLPHYDSLCNDGKKLWFDCTATPLERVRRYGSPAMRELFDGYLFPYFLLRIRLCVVGPCAPRPAPRRRGFFGRLVARRPDVGGARYGLVDEPHLARHVASFLVG